MQDLGINDRFVFMGDRSKRSDIKTRLIDSFKNETLFFVKLLSREGCTLSDETLSGETIRRAKLFVGRNFRHLSKNSSLSPDKGSPDKLVFSMRYGITKVKSI